MVACRCLRSRLLRTSARSRSASGRRRPTEALAVEEAVELVFGFCDGLQQPGQFFLEEFLLGFESAAVCVFESQRERDREAFPGLEVDGQVAGRREVCEAQTGFGLAEEGEGRVRVVRLQAAQRGLPVWTGSSAVHEPQLLFGVRAEDELDAAVEARVAQALAAHSEAAFFSQRQRARLQSALVGEVQDQVFAVRQLSLGLGSLASVLEALLAQEPCERGEEV